MTAQEFIDSISQAALDNYKKYGVLPSLTVAQAALESGWGNSGLAKNSNNLFGIKGTGTAGSVQMVTQEEENGKKIAIVDGFRVYNSQAESIDDHGKLLSGSRYKDVIAANDYKQAATAVKAAGYATDSTYTSQLIDIIEGHKLYTLDEQAKGLTKGTYTPSQSSTPAPQQTGIVGDVIDGAKQKVLSPVMDFVQTMLINIGFIVPGVILLVLALMYLFNDQIKSVVKGVAE